MRYGRIKKCCVRSVIECTCICWQLSQRVKITEVKPLLHDDQSATYSKYMVTVKVQKSESFHYIHVSVFVSQMKKYN